MFGYSGLNLSVSWSTACSISVPAAAQTEIFWRIDQVATGPRQSRYCHCGSGNSDLLMKTSLNWTIAYLWFIALDSVALVNYHLPHTLIQWDEPPARSSHIDTNTNTHAHEFLLIPNINRIVFLLHRANDRLWRHKIRITTKRADTQFQSHAIHVSISIRTIQNRQTENISTERQHCKREWNKNERRKKAAAANDEKWRKRQTNSLSSRTSNMFSILPFDYYQNQFMRAFRNFHPNYGKWL